MSAFWGNVPKEATETLEATEDTEKEVIIIFSGFSVPQCFSGKIRHARPQNLVILTRMPRGAPARPQLAA
jgi:hypothetical protein